MTACSDEFPYIFSKEREDLILADMEKTKEEIMAAQNIRSLSEAKQIEFTVKLCAGLEDPDEPTGDHDYTLLSISGKLAIHIPRCRMYGYEVFCKFSEVNERAIKLGANPHTGKWNHHISDVNMPVDEAVELMISWVKPALL
jgi:hypothetical protein